MTTRSTQERKIAKFRREKRGKGEGADYRPGATVWDDRVAKRVHRVPFMGRQAHLARDTRYAAFLWECYQDETIDILEMFLCDPSETVEIARKLKLRHPQYADGSDRILSADLLVSKCKNGVRYREALSVRYSEDGHVSLNVEHRILNRYWADRGIPWRLHTNTGLNSNWAKHLDFLYMLALRPERAGEGADDPDVQSAVLCALQTGFHTPVRNVCERAMQSAGFPLHFGLNAFHLLLAARRIRFDLDCADVDNEPVSRLIVVNFEPIIGLSSRTLESC
ncbi:hypothetical protein Q8F57_009640 [Paraburkholderia terrae]|uniref:hypothetical protein n=1 Tax=Paraburkholderia terrae TaxID=311230 RepID=UPI00296AFA8B|nr:hypothetical protein [Paraburkholderia terrae]MDW3662555.1 TnsA endonuclease N-terminal domain-containing protein [Paraburkholderia terrae]